ncbi:hypothetical protein FACS1894177_01620 [Bacteroidia bacterium]|nr:hypothetical protein FACS1894177_01620 [Bacteroidia bacterium]
MDENIKYILSQIIMRRMEIKAKLNRLSYFLREEKTVYQQDIDKLLEELDRLEKLENEIRKRM